MMDPENTRPKNDKTKLQGWKIKDPENDGANLGPGKWKIKSFAYMEAENQRAGLTNQVV